MTETPLIQTTVFKEEFGLLKIYIKDESKLPFGTIKDRRSSLLLKEANRLKVDKLVLITSGNNGYSVAKFIEGHPIKLVCIVSKNLPEEVKEKLKKVSYQVIELNLDHKILRPEELIAFAREKEDESIWDVTNSYEESYIPIIGEIIKKVTPDYIVVPLGSGGVFVSMVEGIERYGLKTKVVGIGPQNTVHSFADKLSTPWSPYAKAIQNYEQRGHLIYRLTEDEIRQNYKKYKNLVDCEPSSCIVFAAPNVHKFKKTDTIVFLNSGTTKY